MVVNCVHEAVVAICGRGGVRIYNGRRMGGQRVVQVMAADDALAMTMTEACLEPAGRAAKE